MGFVTIVPLLAALAAAILAWRDATRLDRWSANRRWPDEPAPPLALWRAALGALVVAMVAAMVLQLALLSRLGLSD